MLIEIKNCNNIDSAKISLTENKLNVKFAPNGTGKSTIARALTLGTSKDSDLSDLLPFKLRSSNPENKQPEITGIDNIQNVICFNEDYVNQFVYKQDELLNDSFDIFIRTDEYKRKEEEIEELVAEIKGLFVNNKELENLIDAIKELSSSFKLTTSGISKASTGMKGLSRGNKLQHIPEGLEAYKPFIQSEICVGWVDWQTRGYDYADLADSCPFCTSQAADKKDQIKKVGQEYDKNIIKNLVAIIDVIKRLGDHFTEEAKDKLLTITILKDGLEKEHEDYIVSVKVQIDNFVDKLEKLRTLSSFQFKEGENVAEKLASYELKLTYFSELNSEKTRNSIDPINKSLFAIIEKAGILQGKINQQQIEMNRMIKEHENSINGFLSYAGYKYRVEILGEEEKTQLKLFHSDLPQHLTGGNQFLSFGERNALAVVLFMYECISKNPQIIILDDPISSFDKNKKYAIMEMLFRRDAKICLKNKSVLMLTHDMEPIIDTVKSLCHKFKNQTVASFLKITGGQLSEQDIKRDDVKTFSQICKNALNSDKDDIIKLIYMRRHFEIMDEKGDAYQVLSNLLHRRERLIDNRYPKDDDDYDLEMEKQMILDGCKKISDELPGFSYTEILHRISDLASLKFLYSSCTNGYEKLQVCRLIDHKEEDPVIEKFIKETYHIENEFICQLDPAIFDTIPEYVVVECDKIVANA